MIPEILQALTVWAPHEKGNLQTKPAKINLGELENLWAASHLSNKNSTPKTKKKCISLAMCCFCSAALESHLRLQYHRPTSIAPNSEGRRNQFAALQHPQYSTETGGWVVFNQNQSAIWRKNVVSQTTKNEHNLDPHPGSLTAEKWCLEDDPFLSGRWLFRPYVKLRWSIPTKSP